MDKLDYDNRTSSLIEDSPFTDLKHSPLPKMIRNANEVRKDIYKLFGDRLQWRLLVSNPMVPRLYCLPKIHKPGNKMRPIISNISAPMEKIAKWLVNEIGQLPAIESSSIKNSFEFSDRIKNLVIEEDEIMISFDVESLFPSIPIDLALASLDSHLIQTGVPNDKKIIYMKAAKECMAQNYFQYKSNYYKIEHGTSMENSLSPLIAEEYMAFFEKI